MGTITFVREYAQAAFIRADLEIVKYLVSVETLKRLGDLAYSALHPNRIEQILAGSRSGLLMNFGKDVY